MFKRNHLRLAIAPSLKVMVCLAGNRLVNSSQQRQQLRGSQHQLHHQYHVRDHRDNALNGFSPSPPPPPPLRHNQHLSAPYFYDRRLPPSPPPTATTTEPLSPTMRQFSFTTTLPRRSPPLLPALLPNGGMNLANTLGRRRSGKEQ